MAFRTAFLLLCVVLDVFAGWNDPCDEGNHNMISDGRRSVSFVPGPSDSLICDNYNIIDGEWYRFKHVVGGKIPERCVELFHCGTQAPIWMAGSHPSVYSNTVTRRVCANFGYPGDCCTWTADIDVRRCYRLDTREDYYVYRLVYPPGCSIAYCAGDRVACQPGYVFNNFTLQCDKPQVMFTNVTLAPPVVEENFIHFYCEFDYVGKTPSVDNGARFEVHFYFEDVMVPEAMMVVSAPARRIYMHEKWLRGNLGKSVSCGVRSYWAFQADTKSQEQLSNGYFAGILVEPNRLVVRERDDTPQRIYLKSTLPIACKSPQHHGRCEITVRIVTPRRLVASQSGALSTVGYLQCKYRISKDSWNESVHLAYNASEPLEVMVKRDPYVNDRSTQIINFEPFPYGVPDIVSGENGDVVVHNQIWDGYDLPDITVEVRPDDDMGTCHSTSDPRIRTWDKGGYDILHRIGEFVLWKSNSPRIFEVHVRHWLCREAWFVACTCGVAVREGNTVLAVDMCGGKLKSTPRPKVTQVSDGKLRGASVTRDVAGTSFSINMPSGAYVKMDVHEWGMNVYSYAPSEDINKTEGLCGTFDGNRGNDLRLRGSGRVGQLDEFIESWRIPKGESLFDNPTLGGEVTQRHVQYCKCLGGKSISCDWREKVDAQINYGKPDIPITPLRRKKNWDDVNSPVRRKRSLRVRREAASAGKSDDYTDDVDEDEDDANFDYGLEELPRREFNWPTPSGITLRFARRYCESILKNATSYKVCSEVPRVNVTEPVSRCVDDIRLMDDLTWARNAVREMEYQCLTTAMGVTDTSSPPSKISPPTILKYMCPNQCSARGKCVNGECVCNGEYDGADCSLYKNRAPRIKYITNGGMCDVTERPCRNVRIIAWGVKDSPSLVCLVRHVKIEDDGILMVADEAMLWNATMISINEVACSLPPSPVSLAAPVAGVVPRPVHGLRVAVSNDGEIFSLEQLIVVYDSTCLQCNNTGSCRRKKRSCLIGGRCFEDKEPNPENWCQYCDPNVSETVFTPREGNGKPTFLTPQKIVKVINEDLVLSIVARDPEDRPVSYNLVFATDPEITVNASGEMRWPSHGRGDKMIEVSATDECGASLQQRFQLSTIACKCQNGGDCRPASGVTRGQGHYECACAAGYVGDECQTEANECASSPCVHGTCTDKLDAFECTCRKGYSGSRCDVIAPLTTPNRTREGAAGTWGDWGLWSDCSKPCDYGLMTRRRTCDRLPCSGLGSETRECNLFNCPENGKEKSEGVVLIIRDTTIAQVRIHEQDALSLAAKSVNDYCIEQSERCCREVAGVESSGTLGTDAVSTDDFRFAGGYPKLIDDDLFGLKVIGMVDRERLRALCLHGAREARSTSDYFLPPHVLRVALYDVVGSFKTLYHITVDGIKLPDEELNPAESRENSGSVLGQYHWLVITGVIVVICLIAMLTVIVVVSAHRRRTRNNQAYRSNSLKFLTKNDHSAKDADDVPEDDTPSATEVDDKPRGEGKRDSKSTDNDGSVSSTSSKPKSIRERFFFQYVPRRQSASVEADSGSGRSSVKEKYFYKVAVNEGLGQVDHIDSSTIQLHEPNECKFDTAKGIDTESLAVRFEPKDDSGRPIFTTPAPAGNKFPRGPTRMSTRPSNVLAWKLFDSKP